MRRLTPLAVPLLSALVTSSVLSSRAAAAPPSAGLPVARRYIAILNIINDKVPKCPRVDGWEGSALFDLEKYPVGNGSGYTALKRFCLYTSITPKPTSKPKPKTKPSPFLRIDPDYDVLVPQGSLAQDQTVRESLNQIYRAMLDLGPIREAEKAKVQPIYKSKAPVARVAVIDTKGELGNDPIRARHGLAMGEIINEVRCPAREPECRAKISFVNAFPWNADPAALTASSGEPLGSLGSLARAIHITVSRWARENTGAPLILNLSLGWDPGARNKNATDSPAWAPADWDSAPWDIPPHQRDELLGLNNKWPATAQAVHAALVYASCFDVLTIAAAGNNTRGAEVQTGALAPAKWEKLLAPDGDTCTRLFDEDVAKARRPGNDTITVERRPLVYGVRARMTGNGNALPNSRLGSTSLQISPASYVVAGAGKNRTAPWSGSSVAAATYSGLAAALWSYDRRLTPHQVMALIYETGEKNTTLRPGKPIFFNPNLLLGNTVEAPTSETRARSPNPFEAFTTLCPKGCGYKNPYTKTQNEDYYRWYIPFRDALKKVMAKIPELTGDAPTLTRQGYDNKRTHYYWSDLSPAPPLSEPANAKPWTRPQPQTAICPVCSVIGETLILSLNTLSGQQVDVTLKNPVLEFNLGDPDGFVAVSLGDLPVSSEGLRIPLNRYRIKHNGVDKGLGQAITDSQTRSGTLTVFYKDTESADSRANVSIVQVLWEDNELPVLR